MTDVDVLVVGAGPTGLAMATQLAAFGVRPMLIDRSEDRAHESRALAIQPRTLEVLAGLGITDQLIAEGNPAVELRLHARGRTMSAPLFDLGLEDTAYPYLLFISQAETERILQASIVVHRRTELVGLEQSQHHVIATLRNQDGTLDSVSARYVVGCDGAHSAVRRLARIPFVGSSYPQKFVLADLEADGIEPTAAHAFLSERGLLFCFPLIKPATWRILAMRPANDPTPADAPVDLAEVQDLADAYTGGALRLHDPAWMTNFRLHHRMASQYRSGRVFLAGDAAHIHSPAGAQGMNTGIQDAINLGWKLAYTVLGIGSPDLLDTYDPERAPVGRTVVRFTDQAFTVATSTNPAVRFARSRVAPLLIPFALKASSARAYVFRTVSQLDIRYRHSQLSVNGPGSSRHSPRAGDRFPNPGIMTAPGWHLLLFGQIKEQSLSRYASMLTIHRREGTVVAQFLVRPDGHVGYRAGGPDVDGLINYLDRWMPGISQEA